MIEKLKGKADMHCLTLISDVTYAHQVYWFNNTMRPMKMSLILPKDRPHEGPRPLLVWLCGGGFRVMDKDVWIPQLVYFAQHGYTVASIQYRTTNESVFPDPIVDIKAAIRYLRAHAAEFFIDPTKVVLDYYGTAYLDYEHDIYPGGEETDTGDPDVKAGWIPSMLSSKMPPVMILHGDQDPFVPIQHSYDLHERLKELGVPCDLMVFEGTGHGADEFYQPEILDRVLEFLDKHLK